MSLTQQIKTGASQFLQSLGEGWSKFAERSGKALTRFTRSRSAQDQGTEVPIAVESWGVLAGDVAETDTHLIVRVEAPGMEQNDFDIRVEENLLRIRGEKRFTHEERNASYHVVEAAYGSFERDLLLPRRVDADRAEASYRRGVLTVRLPKLESERRRRVRIH